MNLQIQAKVLEILLHLLAIQRKDILVCDGEDSSPLLVAVCEVGVVGVEDSVDEGEVVFDLFVALDVEAVGGFLDGCFEVRHVECGESNSCELMSEQSDR